MPYNLPDELFSLVLPNGTAFSFDIIDFHIERGRIIAEIDKHPDDDWWYLREFGQWVNTQNNIAAGSPCPLRLAQLDKLWVDALAEYIDRKKKQKAKLRAAQSSQSSTDSIPQEDAEADGSESD